MFGVPEDGITVVPVSPAGRQVVGPAIHTRAMVAFGYGTLSEYRKDADALRLMVERAGIRLTTSDNFWLVSCEALDLSSAYARVKPILERLMRLLSVEYGAGFDYEGLYVDTDEEKTLRWPEPTQVMLFRGTYYDVAGLRGQVEHGFARAMVPEERLDKALGYFANALLIRDTALRMGRSSSHAVMLWAMAFLQLWKAITVILGDPSTDKDYQSRYKKFGLPDGFWKDSVDPLYRIRNDEDVAHYALTVGEVGGLTESFGKAVEVCQRVLRSYSSHLDGLSK